MELNMDWKENIKTGAIGGALWGGLSFFITLFSRGLLDLHLEGTIFQDVVTFIFAGGVFGIVYLGILMALEKKLPGDSLILKSIMVSLFIWGILLFAGIASAYFDPERYHVTLSQIIHGFVLTILLGGILGVFIGKKSPSP